MVYAVSKTRLREILQDKLYRPPADSLYRKKRMESGAFKLKETVMSTGGCAEVLNDHAAHLKLILTVHVN